MADSTLSENAGVPAQGQPFVNTAASEWKTIGAGIQRQILVHGADLMLVKVRFEPGAVGALHHHPHRQATYVVEGSFRCTVGGDSQLLKAGDSFFAAADVPHSVVALEPGALIDCFTPARSDFLETPKA
jgi:quercetin dioxygenase-like cupin family protein